MPRDWHQEQRIWLLQRQCRLTSRQLLLAYAVLSLFSFAVATAFVAMGAWPILFFTALEMSLVACAFLYHARHAGDIERIVLTPDCLLVERVWAGRPMRMRLDPFRTRVVLPLRGRGRGLIALDTGAQRILLGRTVGEQRRRQCAQELHEALNSPSKLF